jgi:hypothetical protein
MADLLDIAPTTAVEVVKINGQRIVVHGLRAPALASIAARFPRLIGLFLGGFSMADVGPKFIAQFGEATGPIIAAGCGHLADEKYEQHAATVLLLEDQLKLVIAIIRLTFPNGFGFFLEIGAALGAAGEEAKVYKIRLRQSPSPSPPSSGEDSRPTMQ